MPNEPVGSAEPEGIYDSLPEDIVKSVLEQSGFQDSEPSEPAGPADSSDTLPSEEAPVEPQPIPEAPGGPLFKDEETEAEVITLPDGRVFPLALVQEWADKSATPPAPILPPAPAQPVLPTAPSTPNLYLPPVTEEDIEMGGPAVKALLIIANRQMQEQAQLKEQLAATQQSLAQQSHRENAEIANSAASSFQSQYNLPDEIMKRVKETVEWHDIQAYIDRDPDPFKATQYALTRSYWNLPEARQYEFERQSANRTAALERKRKLAGISGSGGSGPRGAPAVDENDPQALKQAAIDLARAAMFGDEQ